MEGVGTLELEVKKAKFVCVRRSFTVELYKKNLEHRKKITIKYILMLKTLWDFITSENYRDTNLKRLRTKWLHCFNILSKKEYLFALEVSYETLDEYDLIRDGDRILVGISSSSSSILLLHAIRQFARARGLRVSLAAATIGSPDLDPMGLMLHMHHLKIPYFYEESSNESIKNRLHSIAKCRGYTAVATAESLDKFAGLFFNSILTNGHLETMEAETWDNGIRKIRPFLLIREHCFESTAKQRGLPSRPSKILTTVSSARSLIGIQELQNPLVWHNIRSALKGLLRVENRKSPYEIVRRTMGTRQ